MSIISFTLLSFLSHLPFLAAHPPDFRSIHCFNSKGNYTNSSTYQTNLNILLSHFTSNPKISNYGFTNISYGRNPDRVNSVGLCRGGIAQDECHSCLQNASILLPKLCPNQKEALGSYDQCFLRYSSCSISDQRVLESNSSFHLTLHYLFYNPVVDGSPHPSPPTSNSQGMNQSTYSVKIRSHGKGLMEKL